ncbi:hypothetical protein WG922_05445 [Ramlibacter sp. AN1015]|uniref:hypothetical protein n=1 Tax=Ramlibacter sp. AN1015 TaxID=3133428 RepID=UPI0030BFF237
MPLRLHREAVLDLDLLPGRVAVLPDHRSRSRDRHRGEWRFDATFTPRSSRKRHPRAAGSKPHWLELHPGFLPMNTKSMNVDSPSLRRTQ